MSNPSHNKTQSEDTTKATNPDNSSQVDKKKKFLLQSIFSKKGRNGRASDEVYPGRDAGIDLDDERYQARNCLSDASPMIRKSFSAPTKRMDDSLWGAPKQNEEKLRLTCSSSDRHPNSRIESLKLCSYDGMQHESAEKKEYRMFVGTWNVGGRTPHIGLNLEDFLQVEGETDIYVLGFQEIVPLSAGNVLVSEDNEPATKWLALISQVLNKPSQQSTSLDDPSPSKQSNYVKEKATSATPFQKNSLKAISKVYRANSALAKTCNCSLKPSGMHQRARELREFVQRVESSSLDEDSPIQSSGGQENQGCHNDYCLIANKQMVGIFLSVWVRNDLLQHIGHLRISSMGRGIMGRLGNKGSIAMSMTIHKTSFCFVCSHLASGEKEGDELKRNSDVAEILKNMQFPRICKRPTRRVPERIMDHDQAVWLGDLNYRVMLSYEETRTLVEDNEWESLLEKDQLNIEKQAGRVFSGWKEGKIYFAPTYKYTYNSDEYAGETLKSKKKRRTPAWCDRILWCGDGMEQLQYDRGELKFSDHRPVFALFKAQVEVSTRFPYWKGYASVGARSPVHEVIPQRHSFYEF